MAYLFAVSASFDRFAALYEAAAARGVRLGWLDLGSARATIDPALDEALVGGAFRAARVSDGRSVAAKAVRGRPVVRDIVREHFKGCRAVLVLGGEGLVEIQPADAGFSIKIADGEARTVDAEAFVALVRKPRFDLR